VESNEFDKGANKIISDLVDGIDIREDSYKPDVNKFTDFLKFCKLYPKGNYSQFKKFCQEKEEKK